MPAGLGAVIRVWIGWFRFHLVRGALVVALFAPQTAGADCGARPRARTLAALQELIAAKQVRRILPALDGAFYLQYTQSCCMAGVPLSGTTVYRSAKGKLEAFDICQGSGAGARKIAETRDGLLITEVASCPSGADEACDRALPQRQAELDEHPTRLRWDGRTFVNLNRRDEVERFDRRLSQAIRRDRRRVVLKLGETLIAKLANAAQRERERVRVQVLSYQVARSLRLTRRGQASRAARELQNTLRYFRVGMPSEAGRPGDLAKVALQNDIGFAFEQAGQLDAAERLLSAVREHAPTRVVVHLNLFDVYRKRCLQKIDYPLSVERYVERATKAAQAYVALMKQRDRQGRIPARVTRWLAGAGLQTGSHNGEQTSRGGAVRPLAHPLTDTDSASFVRLRPGDTLEKITPAAIAPADLHTPVRFVANRALLVAGAAMRLVAVEHSEGAGLIVLRREEDRYRVINTFVCEWGGLGCTITLGKPVAAPGRQSVRLPVHTSCCNRGYVADPTDHRTRVSAGCDHSNQSVLLITATSVSKAEQV
jgi:hypothetical protein